MCSPHIMSQLIIRNISIPFSKIILSLTGGGGGGGGYAQSASEAIFRARA